MQAQANCHLQFAVRDIFHLHILAFPCSIGSQFFLVCHGGLVDFVYFARTSTPAPSISIAVTNQDWISVAFRPRPNAKRSAGGLKTSGGAIAHFPNPPHGVTHWPPPRATQFSYFFSLSLTPPTRVGVAPAHAMPSTGSSTFLAASTMLSTLFENLASMRAEYCFQYSFIRKSSSFCLDSSHFFLASSVMFDS